jgi:hypothetical protein
MSIKIDNSVSYDVNEAKKILTLNFRDKYFAPVGIMNIAKDFFNIQDEDFEKVRSQLYENFRELKNETRTEDYPLKMSVTYKKAKLILEKE